MHSRISLRVGDEEGASPTDHLRLENQMVEQLGFVAAQMVWLSLLTMVIRCAPAGRATEVVPVADCVAELGDVALADFDFADPGNPVDPGVLVTPARAEELADVADEVEPGAVDVGSVDPEVLCCVSDFEA